MAIARIGEIGYEVVSMALALGLVTCPHNHLVGLGSQGRQQFQVSLGLELADVCCC